MFTTINYPKMGVASYRQQSYKSNTTVFYL